MVQLIPFNVETFLFLSFPLIISKEKKKGIKEAAAQILSPTFFFLHLIISSATHLQPDPISMIPAGADSPLPPRPPLPPHLPLAQQPAGHHPPPSSSASIAAPTEHPNRSRGRLHLPPAPHTRPPTSTPPQQAVFTAAPDPSTTPRPDQTSPQSPPLRSPCNHLIAGHHLSTSLHPASLQAAAFLPSCAQPRAPSHGDCDPHHHQSITLPTPLGLCLNVGCWGSFICAGNLS